MEYSQALDLIEVYRKSFNSARLQTQKTLEFLIAQESIEARVSSRLKRMEIIIEKLIRESNLGLATMQDIGGCRILMSDLHKLRQIQDVICDNFTQKRKISDYTEVPRKSGYRAVHIVVNVLGKPIEIQLRTQSMHDWAETVEKFSRLNGINLKHDGDSTEHRTFETYARLNRALELARDAIAAKQPDLADKHLDEAELIQEELKTAVSPDNERIGRTE